MSSTWLQNGECTSCSTIFHGCSSKLCLHEFYVVVCRHDWTMRSLHCGEARRAVPEVRDQLLEMTGYDLLDASSRRDAACTFLGRSNRGRARRGGGSRRRTSNLKIHTRQSNWGLQAKMNVSFRVRAVGFQGPALNHTDTCSFLVLSTAV